MERITSDEAPTYKAPLSQAIEHGDSIYVSGQIGTDPETGEAVNGVVDQTCQIFENVAAILESATASLDDVVKASVYLTDLDDLEAMNGVYEKSLTPPYPARSTVEVAELGAGARVEISFVAAKAAESTS